MSSALPKFGKSFSIMLKVAPFVNYTFIAIARYVAFTIDVLFAITIPKRDPTIQ